MREQKEISLRRRRHSISLRAVFKIAAAIAVLLAGVTWWYRANVASWNREQQILNDVFINAEDGTSWMSPMDYRTSFILPEKVAMLLPKSVAEKFHRITELDMSLDWAFPEDFAHFADCEHVTTINISCVYRPRELLTELKRFPRLKRLCVGFGQAADGPDADSSYPFVEMVPEILPNVEIVRE